jgi:hypothetical protein
MVMPRDLDTRVVPGPCVFKHFDLGTPARIGGILPMHAASIGGK